MSLAPGTRLGPYEVTAPSAPAAWARCTQATDTRLGRTVAIKVLPAGVASDPERRRRFEQEARAVAALSHPHICVLHDIGVAGTAARLPGHGVPRGRDAGHPPAARAPAVE